jgi:glutathione S-transferase
MTCIEKGIEHELVPIAYGSDEHGTLHPFRRIPIVEIDGLRLIETLAIASHLDEAFPGPALQPVGQLERARMRTWMGLCGDYLFRDVVRTVPRGREPSADERETARTALERAEGAVGDERFLVGEAVTLADLYLAPQLANCREKAPELLDGLPRLGAWFERIGERESFRLTTDAPS